MARNRCWGISVLACQMLVLSTSLVGVHTQIPAREEVGWASWYGPGFHGRETASGERFSMHQFTAAHRTLPLGTKVLVMNLENDAQVEVKINDRGPYVDLPRRVIDLSRAAAEGLGLRERGVGQVRVMVSEETLAAQGVAQAVLYEVQLGAFLESEQAHEILAQLWARYSRAYVATRDGPVGRYHRVRIGPFATQSQAQQLARILQQEGYAVFVDAVAANIFPAQGFGRADEEHPHAIEAVSRGEGDNAGSGLATSMTLVVVAVGSSLALWTRHVVTPSHSRR